MKRFYLTGQRTFGNRGCEAIVRGTVFLLKERFVDVEVLVASDDIERDKKQWPSASSEGVIFVGVYYTFLARLWGQLLRIPINWIRRMDFPLPIPWKLKQELRSVDAVLSVGGDMYTYEGRFPVWIMAMDGYAIKLGKPTFLWCASVGPFETEPALIPILSNHFARMKFLALRESTSEAYVLEKLGVSEAFRTSDPAFHLLAKENDLSAFWPKSVADGVLGLNVSPLIERFRSDNQNIISEVAAFIRQVVAEKNLSVLLISHVTPLNATIGNNDYLYMKRILEVLSDLGGQVSLMREGLNAVEIKYVISKCRYFIGARTHATIAAISSGVPTISIAYSRKAIGLNEDIFGHQKYVLPTNLVTQESLRESFQLLIDQETEIKGYLVGRIPQLKESTKLAVNKIADFL